jgi:hypothetical protein
MKITIQSCGPDIQLPTALDRVAVTVKSYFDSNRFAFKLPYGSAHFKMLPFMDMTNIHDDRIMATSGAALFAGCSRAEFDRAVTDMGFKESGSVWRLKWNARSFQVAYDDEHSGTWTFWEDTNQYLLRIACC